MPERDLVKTGITVAKMRANPTVRAIHEWGILGGAALRVLPRRLNGVPPRVPFGVYSGLISRAPERRAPHAAATAD